MACLGMTARVMARVELPDRVNFKRVYFRVNELPGRVKCAALEVAEKKTTEKFDRWMKESVGEIVKNLREAPLFVHVYGGDEPDTKLKTEKAVAEEWVILVEELKEGDLGIYYQVEGQNGESTKAWGVLIQGKGEEGGIGCYLLKTSRVGCGTTHYCLVKVKSFRETATSQLTSCWLA